MALPSEGRLSFFGTPAPHHRNGGSIYSGVPNFMQKQFLKYILEKDIMKVNFFKKVKE